MGNMSALKSRLHAIIQTRQITGAMYLLSTSRMKKAMQNIDFNIEYMKELRYTMRDIVFNAKNNEISNPFIEKSESGLTLYVCITSDKGLCGSYNSDVVNKTLELTKQRGDFILLSIGQIGSSALENSGVKPDYSWSDVLSHPSVSMASDISNTIIDLYKQHEINEAYIVFTEYESKTVQNVVCRRVLPLLRHDFSDVEEEIKFNTYPIYEPSIDKVFELLIPEYLTAFMYDVFMQSAASENCARMTAMQNATENADKMISDLSAQINAERQLAITNEILEISAAAKIEGAV